METIAFTEWCIETVPKRIIQRNMKDKESAIFTGENYITEKEEKTLKPMIIGVLRTETRQI